jgi:Zn-dependent protease with chaperone function
MLYLELQKLAIRVGYVHFKPSLKDLVLHLITTLFFIVLTGLILNLTFSSLIYASLPFWQYFLVSLLISLGIQILIVLFNMNAKRKLLATAQEPVKSEIIEYLRNKHPNSHLIHAFRFADIKPASLFLSAGVTTYTWRKNICLISRYFNWKLTDEELIAVLSHEEGHLVSNDIKNSYIISGTEAYYRSLRLFVVFIALVNFLNNSFILGPIFLLIYTFFSAIILITSACLSFIQQYRIYLQEIKADKYGANLVGNEMLAHTLKRLPKVIPAPINDDPLEFLGFRISLLRDRARTLGEPTIKQPFSRFSSN